MTAHTLPMHGIFSIPASADFLSNLAQGICDDSSVQNIPLTDYHIYLPTRRACRALADAFLDLTKGAPLLLPRMMPIGDLDEDDLDIRLTALGEQLNLPPVISPLRRQLLLAQLVRGIYPDRSLAQILNLSQQLATLLDQAITEEISFDRLNNLVPDELATHWGITLEFLQIVSKNWTDILRQENLCDSSDRRIKLLRAQAALWEQTPPSHPIILAGSTGSIPATRHLMRIITTLPKGRVILPALDKDMNNDSWEKISQSHPQFNMKQFLDSCDVTRDEVYNWPLTFAPTPSSLLRQDLISKALSPDMAETFTQNENIPLDGIYLVSAKTPRDEALTIALHMRHVLEHPTKTACLITPNRLIGARVSTLLKRWGIDVDDTAGLTLDKGITASYFFLILNCIEENFSPLSLVQFLNHSFHQNVFQKVDIDLFEKDLLRGPRRGDGVNGLRTAILRDDKFSHHLSLLDHIEQKFLPLQKLKHTQNISTWITALTDSAALFLDETVLWDQDDGQDFLQLLLNIHDQSQKMPPCELSDVGVILRHITSQQTLRRAHLAHPRLTILGQLESRLMQADVMILAGLNEGVWPQDMSISPFLSRPMRADFGLPGLERSTGLSAHDFVSGFCAPTSILTRSLQDDGAATTPARWLQRVEALLKRDTSHQNLPVSPMLQWAQMIDEPESILPPNVRPQPYAEYNSKPQTISVTRIQTLQENPYRFYGERILKLMPLDDLDSSSTHAQRGTIIHEILQSFIESYKDHLPADAENIFLRIARNVLATNDLSRVEQVFWWPRIERIAREFIAYEKNMRLHSEPWLLEQTGQSEIHIPNGNITITAKADRIDVNNFGDAVIIDYKTGVLPTEKKMLNGLAPQLPLEAIILSDPEKGFGTPRATSKLLALKISGKMDAIEEKIIDDKKLNLIIENAKSGVENLLTCYLDNDCAFTAVFISQFGAQQRPDIQWWNHLSRAHEWANESFDDAEEDAA